jgi:hypothetical protein
MKGVPSGGDPAAAKATELYDQAVKKLKSWSPFGNKNEDAAGMLERAGNQFKLAKCWKEAVATYKLLAETQVCRGAGATACSCVPLPQRGLC